MKVLETERLILREFEASDSEFIIQLLNTDGWLRYIGDRHVKEPKQAVQFIEGRLRPSYTDYGFGFYVVESKSSKECLGMCGLVKRDGLDNVDIGYAFLPQNFGKGYAYESSLAVVEFARENLKLKALDSITMSINEPSIELLERLGFSFEKNVLIKEEELMLFRKVF
ncbi:MAG: GNAT family N-acetyltransferase [Bacteroidota bacterium]|nr:GNAT family N-acetyltransferase [Bacteroidota bacterium]